MIMLVTQRLCARVLWHRTEARVLGDEWGHKEARGDAALPRGAFAPPRAPPRARPSPSAFCAVVAGGAAAKAKMAKIGAVGRPTGSIWRIQGTPINTGPAGEVFVDVRAAESARNVLNVPYGGKNRPFWPFFDPTA